MNKQVSNSYRGSTNTFLFFLSNIRYFKDQGWRKQINLWIPNTQRRRGKKTLVSFPDLFFLASRRQGRFNKLQKQILTNVICFSGVSLFWFVFVLSLLSDIFFLIILCFLSFFYYSFHLSLSLDLSFVVFYFHTPS